LSDAAGWGVDHTFHGGIVIRVLNQSQIGQCIPDFSPLEKALAAIHTIGNRCPQQVFLEQS